MAVSSSVQPSQEDRTDVRVFADGPEWDELNGRPWFYVRNPRLLARFSVLDSRFDSGIAQIKEMYPDSVLVF